MMRGLAPWICAGIFSAVHLVLVALPVIASGGSGESQAMLVGLFDLPLVFLLLQTHTGACILYGCAEPSPVPYVVLIPVAGTLMYAVVGFVACAVVRALFRRLSSRVRDA